MSPDASSNANSLYKAMRGGLTGWGTDEKAIFSTLEGKTPAQIAEMERAYQQHFGRDLQADIRSELGGADLARANSLLNPPASATPSQPTPRPATPSPTEDAAAIQKALGGFFGPNQAQVQSLLEGRSPQELKALQDAYQAQTGQSLDTAIASRMRGEDLAVTQSLLSTGTVSEAQRLHQAMDGWGTDEAAIKQALAGKSAAEIAQFERDYQQRYGKSLVEDLNNELSGRDQFEVDQLLRGTPTTPEQALQNMEEARNFERGWSSGGIDFVNNVFKGEADGQRLDAQVTAARDAYDQAMADGAMTQTERQRLSTLMGFANQDLQTYQETKDEAAQTAGTAAVAVATGAAVVATGGAATPLAIAGYAALGAGTKAVVTKAIEGQAMGAEWMLREAAMGALEGGTAAIPGVSAVGQGLSNPIYRAAVNGAAQGAFSGAVVGGADQALRSETWQNGFASGMRDVASGSFQGGLTGGVAGGLSSAAIATVGQALSRPPAPVMGPEPAPRVTTAGLASPPSSPPGLPGSTDSFVPSVYGNRDSAVYFLPERPRIEVPGQPRPPHPAELMYQDHWFAVPRGVDPHQISGLNNPHKVLVDGAAPSGPIHVPAGTDVSRLNLQNPANVVVDSPAGAATRDLLGDSGRNLSLVPGNGAPAPASDILRPGMTRPVTTPQAIEAWARSLDFSNTSRYPDAARVVPVSGHGTMNPDGLAQTLGPKDYVEYYNMKNTTITDPLGQRIEQGTADGLRHLVTPGEAVATQLHPPHGLNITGGSFVTPYEHLSTNQVLDGLRQVFGDDPALVAKWAACRQDLTGTAALSSVTWGNQGPSAGRPGQVWTGVATGVNEPAVPHAPVNVASWGHPEMQAAMDAWRQEALSPSPNPLWQGSADKPIE